MKYKTYKEPKSPRKKRVTSLTNNVLFNERFSPFYFVLMTCYLHYSLGMPFWNKEYFGAIGMAVVSTLVYILGSNYFQPDLDVRANRPGMGHFPIGRWSQNWKIGRFFRWLLYPINRIWYYMWQPYASLLTHRGIGHWPIIGVWLRIGYLLCWFIIFKNVLALIDINLPFLIIVIEFLKSFYPWQNNFINLYWVLFCFPIYLSDLIHIATDFWDSQKEGYSFCPPEIPRGLIIKMIRFLKGENRL